MIWDPSLEPCGKDAASGKRGGWVGYGRTDTYMQGVNGSTMTVPGHPPVVMNLAGFRAITRQVSFDFNTTSSCGDPKSGIVFPAWDEHDPMPLANGAPLVSEADARPPYQIIYSKNDRSPWIDAYNADPFICK